MDHSPRGSSVHGILQERTQEWVAMPTPSRSSRPSDYIISLPCLQWQVGSLPLAPPGKPLYLLCAQPLSCVRLFVIPWTVARQAPLSMGFSRQEQWSGLPFLIPGDLPDSGIEPTSLASSALAGDSLSLVPAGKPFICYRSVQIVYFFLSPFL